MKIKLDLAWKKYKDRFRLAKWLAESHYRNGTPLGSLMKSYQPNIKHKFEKYACKLLGRKDVTFEWQTNGDCIVAGVIYLTLIQTT